MKKKRFTEQQIIGFLKGAKAGLPVKDHAGSTDSVMQRSTVGARSSEGCSSTRKD